MLRGLRGPFAEHPEGFAKYGVYREVVDWL